MFEREPADFNTNDRILRPTKSGCFVFLMLLFLLFWINHCNDDRVIVEKPPGIITGVVVDSFMQSPLEDAWVGPDSIFDTTLFIFSITDSVGHYRYPTLSLNGQLYCGKEGYYTKSNEYQVAHGESIVVDFYLARR